MNRRLYETNVRLSTDTAQPEPNPIEELKTSIGGLTAFHSFMPKVKNGQDAMLTRNQYNELKRMDRTDAEDFAQEIYKKGYTKGGIDAEVRLRNEVPPPVIEHEENRYSIFMGELRRFVASAKIPGIGSATLLKITEAAEKWGEET